MIPEGMMACFVSNVTVRFCHAINELPSGSASAEFVALSTIHTPDLR